MKQSEGRSGNGVFGIFKRGYFRRYRNGAGSSPVEREREEDSFNLDSLQPERGERDFLGDEEEGVESLRDSEGDTSDADSLGTSEGEDAGTGVNGRELGHSGNGLAYDTTGLHGKLGRHFAVISPTELDKEDFKFLEDAPFVKRDFVKRIVSGLLLVWRFTSPEGRGVIVTSVELVHTGDKELFIWWLNGSGMGPHKKWLIARLAEFARFNNCKTIGLGTDSKRMAVIYRKTLGFSEESVKMVKEI